MSQKSTSKSRKRLLESTSPEPTTSKRHHVDKENDEFPIDQRRRSRSMDSAFDKRLIIRKSSDLKRFKSIDDQVTALINSPMIEVRKKRPSQDALSQSFSGDSNHRNVSDHLEEIKSSRKSISFFMERSLNYIRSEQSLNQSSFGNSPDFVSPQSNNQMLKAPPNTPVVFLSSPDSIEEKDMSTAGETFPSADHENLVHHCQLALYKEWNSLNSIIVDWNAILEEEGSALPDKASGDVRCTIGMGNLLLRKKFTFFDKLIKLALGQTNNEDQPDPDLPTTRPSIEDLRGYWDLVLPEVEKINSAFERLAKWRELNWVEVNRPDTPRPTVVAVDKKPAGKFPPPRGKTKLSTQLAKSRLAAFKAANNLKEKEKTEMNTDKFPGGSVSDSLPDPDARTSRTRTISGKSVSFTSDHHDVAVTPTLESGLTQRYRKTPRQGAIVESSDPAVDDDKKELNEHVGTSVTTPLSASHIRTRSARKAAENVTPKTGNDQTRRFKKTPRRLINDKDLEAVASESQEVETCDPLSPDLSEMHQTSADRKDSSRKFTGRKQSNMNKSVSFSTEHQALAVTPTEKSGRAHRYRKTPIRGRLSKLNTEVTTGSLQKTPQSENRRGRKSVELTSPLASNTKQGRSTGKSVNFSSDKKNVPVTPTLESANHRFRKTPRRK